MIPRATYRLQLNRDFTFDQAAALAPYLAELGISHVYASPILMARAGSMHGYDVVDHSRINPELGGEEGFTRLSTALRAHGLGLILDIVPNHMAVGGGDNGWWLDVLEKGGGSPYARFFDVDFDALDPTLSGKVLAPFLGAPYGEVLRSGEIKIERSEALGKLVVAYYHHVFPIRPEDQAEVAADPGRFAAPGPLHALLERQNFRLAWWRTAGDQINWRRFFNITELAGLRVELPEVFEAVHRIVFDLYARGMIDGVRVDHVDGLADPAGYCRRLRARLGELRPGHPAWLIVEKILAPGEELPSDWGIDGTTGYDFMNQVSALQHDPGGEEMLTALWIEASGRPGDFDAEECVAREEILVGAFDGQLEHASAAFRDVALRDPDTRDYTQGALRRALMRIIRRLRVYRTYTTGALRSPAPGSAFAHAVQEAEADMPSEHWPVRFIEEVLTRPAGAGPARLLNQLTAPVAAKAVEDTAFYRYGRLLSRNDVGFEPARLSIGPDELHAIGAARAANWPQAMLATATHDHKRGEDVRARLAVLSELPDLWRGKVIEWTALTASIRPKPVTGGDAYQLYQTLVGAWPLDLGHEDAEGLAKFRERIAGWQLKALREAKLGTNWSQPDEAFEAANRAFVDALLDPHRSRSFLLSLSSFVDHIAPAGALNSLAQLVLKLTFPGVPDTYQGTEFWDQSLVDPDNRRPVDYRARAAALEGERGPAVLVANWRDGRIKQQLLVRLLALRAAHPALFRTNDYRRLEANGPRAAHLFGFARRHGQQELIVAVPLRCAAAVAGSARLTPPEDWWEDTKVAEGEGQYQDWLTETSLTGDSAAGIFRCIPAMVRVYQASWKMFK